MTIILQTPVGMIIVFIKEIKKRRIVFRRKQKKYGMNLRLIHLRGLLHPI